MTKSRKLRPEFWEHRKTRLRLRYFYIWFDSKTPRYFLTFRTATNPEPRRDMNDFLSTKIHKISRPCPVVPPPDWDVMMRMVASLAYLGDLEKSVNSDAEVTLSRQICVVWILKGKGQVVHWNSWFLKHEIGLRRRWHREWRRGREGRFHAVIERRVWHGRECITCFDYLQYEHNRSSLTDVSESIS